MSDLNLTEKIQEMKQSLVENMDATLRKYIGASSNEEAIDILNQLQENGKYIQIDQEPEILEEDPVNHIYRLTKVIRFKIIDIPKETKHNA